ncbi:AbrB/MazE/SpoVT family DNA-binding domain-containing protein [Phreatobacter oligotrophus]|uniref:AbrB family transcriptional regulator n=1 Tax=Phreatobacter oligotrophus TaxID=1122261 RepID=A0A2T4YXH3_9HYPH|nr:AbrB/MazE/SpoVT family DNA-binding domain-containing protein [Phreatobacter oligotrophus]PTM50849.1 AbrB family transcriptional regulator [Phreatobacter oligotrophus]
MATTVTQKGQVTIPKRVRDALGIVPGSKVEFTPASDGRIVLTKAGDTSGSAGSSRFAKIRGSADLGMSTDEIMALLRGGPDE